MTAAVVLDRATLAVGGRVVLEAVSLAIGEGEFVAVLGPNGAGKTTLLRALLGLLRPRSGTISVLGGAPARGNPAVGYLPQAVASPGPLRVTGRDMVAAAVDGWRWGLPLSGARAEADRVLAAVDATRIAGRPVGSLSGGERQRLRLAAALVGTPRLLLLDEPLISLDPARQEETVALVDRVRRRLGLTVLFSAHEINPLLGSVDRVLYLGGGGAAIGRVEEVVTAPVLSRLYGAPIEVIETAGRLLVVSGGREVERDAHAHDHGGDVHGHHDHGGQVHGGQVHGGQVRGGQVHGGQRQPHDHRHSGSG